MDQQADRRGSSKRDDRGKGTRWKSRQCEGDRRGRTNHGKGSGGGGLCWRHGKGWLEGEDACRISSPGRMRYSIKMGWTKSWTTYRRSFDTRIGYDSGA